MNDIKTSAADTMGTAKRGHAFDPVTASRHISTSYRDYLTTTLRFEDPSLQGQLEQILSRQGFLSKGPFLEATPPYTKGETVRQLVDEGLLCQGMLSLGGGDPGRFNPDMTLYAHQVEAIRNARAGKNFIVTTGTGSGKTECFLLPILDDILREQEEKGPQPGIRAMILYPMNALANDQLKRLRQLLAGTDITFGRYVGDSKETKKDAENAWRVGHPGQSHLPNELLSREEMRATPPNIMLTNYAMLEYLLLRPKDAPLFSSMFGAGEPTWRHIAIDESHVYAGTLGTEIAYLIRRLKARVKEETGSEMRLHCYATSATMGSDSDSDRRQVAQFAEDLFGEPFDHGDDPAVISSRRDDPMSYFRGELWGALPPEVWVPLRDEVADGVPTAEGLRAALAGTVPTSEMASLSSFDPKRWLSGLLLGDQNSKAIVARVSDVDAGPLDLTDFSSIDELGIEGLTPDRRGAERLSAMVEVLSFTEFSEGVPILASRYHSFLRAPEGLFICLDDMTLTPTKGIERENAAGETVPIYEVSVCRHCGEAYILGRIESSNDYAWLNPENPDIDTEDYAARTYYRILRDGEEADEREEEMWLCPKCGELHDAPVGGPHRSEHGPCERIHIAEGTANEDEARCGHCGYRNRHAIQPVRVSPDAAGSVVCYDLVRDVPPFQAAGDGEDEYDELFGIVKEEKPRGGSIVCFSDRRQDAAAFAPAMLRTSNNITRRQIIRETVEELCSDNDGCKPSDVAERVAVKLRDKYWIDGGPTTSLGRKHLAEAWVYDELMAEDSRNSLEGLGMVRVSPEPVIRLVDERPGAFEELARRMGVSWMTGEDYVTIMRVCLETLRERGALERPDGAGEYMQIHAKQSPVVRGGDDEDAKDAIRFVAARQSRGNKRSDFVISFARARHGVDVSRAEADRILINMYEGIKMVLSSAARLEHGPSDTYVRDDGKTGGYLLKADLWTLRPASEGMELYLCDTCGCMLQYDTHGVCLTRGCKGHPKRVRPSEVARRDRYYKELYRENLLPLSAAEHTAQLSTERARAVQQKFIEGKVNVLSCTTTFELGVDVGDLRATFMRNVPPSPANYTQRAGRVGR